MWLSVRERLSGNMYCQGWGSFVSAVCHVSVSAWKKLTMLGLFGRVAIPRNLMVPRMHIFDKDC